MPSLSQAPPFGDLPSPHGAFQGHAAHRIEWPIRLRPKGSTRACTHVGDSTFLPCAFTAHELIVVQPPLNVEMCLDQVLITLALRALDRLMLELQPRTDGFKVVRRIGPATVRHQCL